MVRIKVIKKSQIIAGTLAAIAAAALLAGIWIAWRRGAFGGGGGYGLSGKSYDRLFFQRFSPRP